MEHIVGKEVADEGAAATQEARVFQTLDGRADQGIDKLFQVRARISQ